MNKYPREFVSAVFFVFLANMSLQFALLFFSDFVYSISEIWIRNAVFIFSFLASLIIVECIFLITGIFTLNKKTRKNFYAFIKKIAEPEKNENTDLSGFWWAVLCCVLPIFSFKLMSWKIIMFFGLHLYGHELDLSVAIVPYVALRSYFSWKYYVEIRDGRNWSEPLD